LGAVAGPLADGYMYAAVGFFKICVIMGSFLFLCSAYVFFFTGPRGKFIVRPQDRKSSTDEEVIVGIDVNNSNHFAVVNKTGSDQVEDIPEIESYVRLIKKDDSNQIHTKSN
jgi:hypothetical protein